MANRIFDVLDHNQIFIDYASATINYYGYSSPNVKGSDKLWRIRRETLDSQGRTIKIEFADGNQNFNNVWNDRASLNYGA